MHKHAISLGAGVQSTCMALMAMEGELTPMPIAAIFADTGWEPNAVYRHLDWLESVLPFPVFRVSAGNIRDDILASTNTTGQRFASLPLHIRNADGTDSLLRRQCTKEYKIMPLNGKLKALGASHRTPITTWIGITTDEAQRMKTSRVKYSVHRWPLIELRMTRHDCLLWMERHGYPRPTRSACIGCPFRDNAAWRDIRANDDEWAEACEVDEAVRHHKLRLGNSGFLHRQCVPLDDADLSTPEDHGQLSLWGNECEGMCGV